MKRLVWFLLVLMLMCHGLAGLAQQRDESGDTGSVVNFRVPVRRYRTVCTSPITIYAEEQLLTEDPQSAQAAVQRLQKNVPHVLSLLPARAAERLRSIPYYLLYGSNAAAGGRDSGLVYFRPGAPSRRDNLDERWSNCIVVYSARNYAKISDLWALKAPLHELSHAFQLLNWAERQENIYAAWSHAVSSGLYLNAADDKGKIIPSAYALKNQLEYFAELSCMYFANCNYFPNNRTQLAAYDPVGYKMIEYMWFSCPLK